MQRDCSEHQRVRGIAVPGSWAAHGPGAAAAANLELWQLLACARGKAAGVCMQAAGACVQAAGVCGG